jgi:serine protease AprX
MSKGESPTSQKQSKRGTAKPDEQQSVSQPPRTEIPVEPVTVSAAEKGEPAGETSQPGRPEPLFDVIIDVNLFYHAGRQGAKTEVLHLISEVLLDEKNKKSWRSKKTAPQDSIDVRMSDPKAKNFIPEVLGKTVIALPLFRKFAEERKRPEDEKKKETGTKTQGIYPTKTMFIQQYVFARLKEEVIKELVHRDGKLARTRVKPEAGESAEGTATTKFQKAPRGRKFKKTLRGRAIYHIWPDFEVEKLTTASISTVKADAAHNAFAALGKDIVWPVMDSGIEDKHPHFDEYENLANFEEGDPLRHRDFTAFGSEVAAPNLDDPEMQQKNLLAVREDEAPLEDVYGHGTHVAGIIAGGMKAAKNKMNPAKNNKMFATIMRTDEHNTPYAEQKPIETDISGMAPRCKLVSLKVLDNDGGGSTSNLIAAIAWIQEINGHGRHIRIHGVNMSVGYEYDPQWFACGQSPLCVEVNRLVKSGVVVVVAAGNTGYGLVFAQGKQAAVTAGLDLTINDPGNADFAITVGSTHRDMPHIYGVSYFSSKGPTGDGRLKPDLLAPGEKIISCHSSQSEGTPQNSASVGYYKEDSGTSMAAPHVSGVIAAFLSIRREFIGQPEKVKEIFMSTATDLKRERYFQGHGLVDLMRAIQSV